MSAQARRSRPSTVAAWKHWPLARAGTSIVDAAATGTDPTHIFKAVRDAINRGLVEPDSLRTAAACHPNQQRRDVRRLIEEVLSSATTGTR